MLAVRAEKVYTIKAKGINGSSTETTGTVDELVQMFRNTLERGRLYQKEVGNKEINIVPQDIDSLVRNLNNAAKNAACVWQASTNYILIKGK